MQLAGNVQRTGYVATEAPGPWQLKWIWNGPVNGGDAGPASGHLQLPQGVQPVVGNGLLFVGHSDGRVRAISEATGQVAWTAALGGSINNAGAYDPDTNSVYFGSTNGNFYRLNANDGHVERSNRPGGEVVMAPLVVGNAVYVGTTTHVFYGFDKTSLAQNWSYDAGAALRASPAYSANYGGLIIILAEDKSVHALQISTGARRWRVTVNGDPDPLRGNTIFADTYPVVSDANDVVLVRSYSDWDKMWQPTGGAPNSIAGIRSFLSANPDHESFFVLELSDGEKKYIAPVLPGSIGNGGDFQSVPPQAVVKRFSDGTEVAYLLWRNKQACLSSCDGREDTTLGEMNLQTGDIRFVDSHKNEGSLRLPTDEHSPLSMAGDSLFHAHWMALGGVRITDRSASYGGSFGNPIRTQELTPVLNTLASGSCSNRNSSNHSCPQDMYVPGDSYRIDPGFYIYYYNQRVYDQYWTTPVRSAAFNNGTIYWKSIDGAIIALKSQNSQPSVPPSSKTASPGYGDQNDNITFTITVGGSGKATTVIDTLPTQLTYISDSDTCPGDATYNAGARQISYSNTLTLGATCTIQIVTQVNIAQIAAITNTANINNGISSSNVSATVILNGYHVYLPVILKSF